MKAVMQFTNQVMSKSWSVWQIKLYNQNKTNIDQSNRNTIKMPYKLEKL